MLRLQVHVHIASLKQTSCPLELNSARSLLCRHLRDHGRSSRHLSCDARCRYARRALAGAEGTNCDTDALSPVAGRRWRRIHIKWLESASRCKYSSSPSPAHQKPSRDEYERDRSSAGPQCNATSETIEHAVGKDAGADGQRRRDRGCTRWRSVRRTKKRQEGR